MNTATMPGQIQEHMEVLCSTGCKVGVVDHVEGGRIKLTKKDSKDGQHHYIPMSMVSRIDEHVHLSKPGAEVMQEWESE
jgi:hypothetical protein